MFGLFTCLSIQPALCSSGIPLEGGEVFLSQEKIHQSISQRQGRNRRKRVINIVYSLECVSYVVARDLAQGRPGGCRDRMERDKVRQADGGE
jgi:hypothetical protein